MHDRKATNGKPWIDVGMMALARKSAGTAILSLLSHWRDRADFNIRLICHVDALPFSDHKLARHLWRDTMQDALGASLAFDDVVLIGATCNQGYGGSFHKILSEVSHPLLYQDDDQYWRRSFRLGPMLKDRLDYYSFVGSLPCGTAPSLWSLRLVKHLLRRFPEPKHNVTERDLMCLFNPDLFTTSRRVVFAREAAAARRKHFPVVDVGKAVNRRYGIPTTGPHQSIFDRESGRRHRKLPVNIRLFRRLERRVKTEIISAAKAV
jgi:hypothetical protein